MQIKQLIESEPNYSNARAILAHRKGPLPCSINIDCPREGFSTTWVTKPEVNDELKGGYPPTALETVAHVQYMCTSCYGESVDFLLHVKRVPIDDDDDDVSAPARFEFVITKVGQHPGRKPRASTKLRKALPRELFGFYLSALVCLENNRGLGAVAYMRRVIEESGRLFLDLLEKDASLQGDTERLAKIAEARKTKAKGEMLKAGKDLLPSHLCNPGFNPLARMYHFLSEGLHGKSDEECLDLAVELRENYDFMFEEFDSIMKRAAKLKKLAHKK